MEDLNYIVSLGFSGGDLPRAIILSFLFAMAARKEGNIWRLGLYALIIDRAIWPLIAMAATGADIHSIYASIGALFKTFFDDLGIYIVRYAGIVSMIGAFRWARSRMHRPATKKSKPATA